MKTQEEFNSLLRRILALLDTPAKHKRLRAYLAYFVGARDILRWFVDASPRIEEWVSFCERRLAEVPSSSVWGMEVAEADFGAISSEDLRHLEVTSSPARSSSAAAAEGGKS